MNLKWSKQVLILLLCCLLVRFTAQAESFGPTGQASEQPSTPPVPHSPQELQQLVAPIALYPDALVAQILAASTYPTEIVEADRWMQSHANLKGEELAKEVDKQPWDPSVKALAQFPSVLENMDKNLSWTSSLGDAYANEQQDVTDAVQVMRQQAHKAGHLNSNEQEKVTTQGNTIIIEPANPEVVYVPAYDPWLVYGYPVAAWPGWYPYPGIWFGGPYLSFGVGFGIGWWGGFGWGWGHWGFDWHNHYARFNGGRYYSGSRTFYNRGAYARGGFARGGGVERGGGFDHGGGARPFDGNRQAARGYAAPHGQSGVRSGAFGGYDHGGQTRSFSSRGSASS